MKKLFTLVVVVLMAVATVNAKPYKFAIGAITGMEWGASMKMNVMDNFTIMDDLSYDIVISRPSGYQGFFNHLNLAYQDQAASGDGIDLGWYVGGGVSIGYVDPQGFGADGGKFGINAIAGIEANMKSAPIAFTLDFRPGYACLFGKGFGDGINVGTSHTFDWALTLGVRYTLPN